MRSTCTVEGCDRPNKARGYCQSHYMHFQRGLVPSGVIRSRVRTKPPECIEEGCPEPVKAKGLCKMHYQRLLRHGHTFPRARTGPIRPCSLDGCDNHLYSKGLCHTHYIKQRRWKEFGVDADGYQEMLRRQNHVCAICGKPETSPDKATGKTKHLAVDHCHKTNKVRGLLCSSCNRGIGLFQDDPALLAKARDYVLYDSQSGI